MPPPSAASRVGSRVVMKVHGWISSVPVRFKGARSGSCSFCASNPVEPSGLSNPRSRCRLAMTWFASLRRSSKGNCALFAISNASSVSKSVVVTECFSSDGSRWVYDLVGKSGITWRRSVIQCGLQQSASKQLDKSVFSTLSFHFHIILQTLDGLTSLPQQAQLVYVPRRHANVQSRYLAPMLYCNSDSDFCEKTRSKSRRDSGVARLNVQTSHNYALILVVVPEIS